MKSIITFGLALMATFASNASTYTGLSEIDTVAGFGNGNALREKFSNEETVLHPSAYIASAYVKTQEQTAKDDAQVIDAQEAAFAPLYFETPVSEINENNRVTEAQMLDYAPLDFNYINKAQNRVCIPDSLPKL